MNIKTTTIISLIFAGAMIRLIPHAPNFSPIGAIALFGGALIANKWLKFIVPFAALFISDFFIGFYGLGMLPVYGSFALIIGLGTLVKGNKLASIGLTSVAGSVLFYLITNFAPFTLNGLYANNFGGIMQSYIAGLPFFQNTLFADLFYNTVLFGGFYLLSINVKALKTVKA